MINIEIPGRQTIEIEHLVLDYNGTIAVDGKLIESIKNRLLELSDKVTIHVLTADTYGTVREQCDGLGLIVESFPCGNAAEYKLEIVKKLKEKVCCIGNGFNDIMMFGEASLSIAVLEHEGLCSKLLPHSDVLVPSAEDALDLLLKPDRLRATLRG